MEENDAPLTRRERRSILREERKFEENESFLKKNWLGFVFGLVLLALVLGGGYFLLSGSILSSGSSLPGQTLADQGRGHVPDGTVVSYNSNPPSSGSHYAEWTRAGVFSRPISDGHLIHSLEHGYVILSYNCEKPVSSIEYPVSIAYAHEEELEAENKGEDNGRKTEELGDSAWKSDDCRDLVTKLTGVYEKKGKKKLIVIPRSSLDARIALTAWTRIDKLDSFDENRIIKFIDAFRNKGPEKTME